MATTNGRIAIAITTEPSYSGEYFHFLPELLCRDHAVLCFDSLPIEGSDIFATDGHLLVNAAYNRTPPLTSYHEYISGTALTHAFGAHNIVWIGNTGQEAAHMHLDLTVTPTGRRDADGHPIVVVGDMRRTLEVLGGRDDLGEYEYRWGRREAEWNHGIGFRKPHYEQILEEIRREMGPTEDEYYAQVFGEALGTEKQQTQPTDAMRYMGAISRVYADPGEFVHRMTEQLDIYARQLETAGFAVRRIPYLDTHDDSDWRLPILSYNNVLVENYRDKDGTEHHVVTMPTYDIPPLDEAAQAVYEGLGFVVIPVRGFVAAATYAGALHCMVKVLNRTEH